MQYHEHGICNQKSYEKTRTILITAWIIAVVGAAGEAMITAAKTNYGELVYPVTFVMTIIEIGIGGMLIWEMRAPQPNPMTVNPTGRVAMAITFTVYGVAAIGAWHLLKWVAYDAPRAGYDFLPVGRLMTLNGIIMILVAMAWCVWWFRRRLTT